jgi:twitching motility protein PilI
MDEMAVPDPVSILRKIEESCRACCTTDQQHSVESCSEWSGIAFRVGDNSLIAALDEVVEILDMPKLARVPLAQPWVCGIANIRGNMLPVVDFSGFLN